MKRLGSTMNSKDFLSDFTIGDNAGYVSLRLGEDPGLAIRQRALEALNELIVEFEEKDELPRDVALFCGVILQFSSQCNMSNAKLYTAEYGAAELSVAALRLLSGKFSSLIGL